MKRKMNRIKRTTRVLTCQPLESRFVLAASLGWDGPGLGSAALTYHIANSPSSLSQADANAAIEKALSVWSAVANISFTPTTQVGLRDSLDISFSRLDGAGGTLAQAYFPDDANPARIAGDVQFDAAEVWEVGNDDTEHWGRRHGVGHSPLAELVRFSPERLLGRFDANSDTNLTEDEVPQRLWQRLIDGAVDADADGIVTQSELEVAAAAAREAYFADFDTDQDGLLVESEVGAATWQWLSSADTDDNLGVSLEELSTWIADQPVQRPDLAEHADHGRHHHEAVARVFGQAVGRMQRPSRR